MDILKAEIERKRKHLEEKELVGVSNWQCECFCYFGVAAFIESSIDC